MGNDFYKKEKKKKQINKEIVSCVDEINKTLKKYNYKADISEWFTLTNKNGSFSFETDSEGQLVIQ
mgnify:CR=1 FL=1